jgi:hypothetical protein
MAKRKFDPAVPPCPDSERYLLVKGKYRYHWRLKRGTVKPAVLNDVMKKSAAITAQTNQAAKQMMSLLSVFTQRMKLGTATTRVAGAFKKAYLKNGRMDFSFMEGLLFQEDFPINRFFTGIVQKQMINGSLQLNIEVGRHNIKRHSKDAVTYQLHAIMLYGDPAKERGIKIETDESRTYSYDEEGNIDCQLSLVLPPKNRPWIVLLHIGTKFRVSFRAEAKFHAMMVVATG